MAASLENPVYSAFIIAGDTQYDVTPVLIGIDFSEQEKQMATRATLNLLNIKVSGKWLNSLLSVRQRVMIYANDGTTQDEVFRGFIWKKPYKSSLKDREITLNCYDNLMYLQESSDYQYFSAGQTTKNVISSICNDWGIPLNYQYQSITHEKLALKGTLSDMMMSDVLDLVKDRTGEGYVMRSVKDTLLIAGYGQNTTVYQIQAKESAVSTRSEQTMEGMVTKVKILGKEKKDERRPVEATLSSNTGEYGTLQKVIDRDENTSLADAKQEAQKILDQNDTPKWKYEIKTTDIPWIHKGDKVFVNAGDIYEKYLHVLSVDRDIGAKSKTMTLTCEKAG